MRACSRKRRCGGGGASRLWIAALLACAAAAAGCDESNGRPGSDADADANGDALEAEADTGDAEEADAEPEADVEGDAGDAEDDGGDAEGGLPWVGVAPGGRYFRTEGGGPFVAIGNQPGTGFLDLPDADIDAHFARMESFGETVARLDFDVLHVRPAPEYLGLESAVGVYDPARVERLDAAFRLAGAHGIRILVVPWITSPPMWESWPLNPYSTDLGGPADDPYEFLTSAEARDLFGNRLEWISARWGVSGTFFAWDLMNESDVLLRWGDPIDDPASLESWVLELGGRVRDFETSSHGRTHPRMVSWSSMVPPDAFTFLFRSAGLDTASTHPYDFYGTQLMDWPDITTSVVEPAVTVRERLQTILGSRIADRRPYVENERHMNHQTMLAFHREADHDIAWAELVSGAAGTGITWITQPDPWSGPPDTASMVERHENLGPDRRALRDFVDLRVPAEFFLLETTDEGFGAVSSGGVSVAAMSVRRGPYAIGWILGTDERCVLVECVDEVRDEIAAGDPPDGWEQGLAVVLWRKVLVGEGVPVEDSNFADLLAAAVARDGPAIAAELPGVLAYLEGLEATYGTLASLAECPDLSPEVAFAMPAGDYRVDWIDDGDGAVVRSDTLSGGSGTLVAPAFRRHIALVVAPAE